jgi:iron-sulfur cluster repair protein YtfE (RIC family)
LLLCLQINKGIPAHFADADWLKSKAEHVVEFFDDDLTPHFRAEEQVLFPAMGSFSEAVELIADLLSDHRRLTGLVDRVRAIDEQTLAVDLVEFAAALEGHVRKEERELFPIYEALVSTNVANDVARGVIERVGTALEPHHPERFK